MIQCNLLRFIFYCKWLTNSHQLLLQNHFETGLNLDMKLVSLFRVYYTYMTINSNLNNESSMIQKKVFDILRTFLKKML